MKYNVTEIIAKEAAIRNEANIQQWKKEREILKDYMQTMVKNAKHISVSEIGGLCPYLIFVTIDALDRKDYPNGIAENSSYLTFEIDLYSKKVELFRCGSVWLSPSDRQTDKYRYLAMKSMVNVLVDKGGSKFRKQSYKTMQDVTMKMAKYYDEVMNALEEYTGGYPYYEGK